MTTITHTPTPSSLGFLDLPAEIRVMIYRNVFESLGDTPVRHVSQMAKDLIEPKRHVIAANGIMRTCRTVYQESVLVFYSTVCIHLSLNPLRGLRLLTNIKNKLAIIQHLSVDFEYSQLMHQPIEIADIHGRRYALAKLAQQFEGKLCESTFTLHLISDAIPHLSWMYSSEFSFLNLMLNAGYADNPEQWSHGRGQFWLEPETSGGPLPRHHSTFLGRALCKIQARDMITLVAFAHRTCNTTPYTGNWANVRSAIPGTLWATRDFDRWAQINLSARQRRGLDYLGKEGDEDNLKSFPSAWHYRPHGSQAETLPSWEHRIDAHHEATRQKGRWINGCYIKDA
ncbi:uncharacterized protein KY384_005047 [Bacidia gigantensis]|uniref:uncharacterized protein n=1 Tax=Bacidia gigantensis TaxID=2732470 RepID=UPI001D04D9A6|nr:uncharacterized protein KY384_005047 [Bacidia gigantensis]KAG8530544.1 hypothetical protein KY384_005047 [Bacidia gigantensis]